MIPSLNISISMYQKTSCPCPSYFPASLTRFLQMSRCVLPTMQNYTNSNIPSDSHDFFPDKNIFIIHLQSMQSIICIKLNSKLFVKEIHYLFQWPLFLFRGNTFQKSKTIQIICNHINRLKQASKHQIFFKIFKILYNILLIFLKQECVQ